MFVIDGSVLAAAIGSAVKVLGKEPESLVLSDSKARPNHLLLRGYADGQYITHEFPAVKVEGKFRFGVPVDRLVAVSNRRAALQFDPAAAGGSISYSAVSGSYKGHIETLEVKPIDFPKIKESDIGVMSDQLKTAIFELFPLVSLSPMFVSRDMVLFVEMPGDGRVRVAAADDFHAALAETFITSKKKKGDAPEAKPTNDDPASYTFPFKYVNVIASCFPKSLTINMGFDQAHLHIYNESTRISLPLMSTSGEDVSMAGIRKYFDDFAKKRADADFVVDVGAIKLCMNNMDGIRDTEKTSELRVSVSESKLSLRMDSRHGSISDSLTVDNTARTKAQIKLEPTTTQDVLSKIEGECSVRFYERRLLVLESRTKSHTARYLAVGIADTATDKEGKKKKEGKDK